MRILLVTWTENLSRKLRILNRANEYCAIVVDEVKPAQKILERVGLPKSLLRPLYELKECVRDFYYDYVVCAEEAWWSNYLEDEVHGYGVSWNKILNFYALTFTSNFLLERALRYFSEHAANFDMFATGISYVEKCLDVTQFKRKLFNFGRGSQDLYYNFQVAKFVTACADNRIRYALIGLAPYSFHYDLTKTPHSQHRILQHFIAFGDVHNFHVPADVYGKIFSEKYPSLKISLEPFDLNDPFQVKSRQSSDLLKPLDANDPFQYRGKKSSVTARFRLAARKTVDTWSERFFPDTRAENVQILDDYLTLCEGNDIRPIMFLPPMTEAYVKYFNRQRLDEFYYLVECAIKKHPSAIFIDGWKLQGFTDADFYDVDHLNLQGAAKFSAALNGVIEQLDGR